MTALDFNITSEINKIVQLMPLEQQRALLTLLVYQKNISSEAHTEIQKTINYKPEILEAAARARRGEGFIQVQ